MAEPFFQLPQGETAAELLAAKLLNPFLPVDPMQKAKDDIYQKERAKAELQRLADTAADEAAAKLILDRLNREAAAARGERELPNPLLPPDIGAGATDAQKAEYERRKKELEETLARARSYFQTLSNEELAFQANRAGLGYDNERALQNYFALQEGNPFTYAFAEEFSARLNDQRLRNTNAGVQVAVTANQWVAAAGAGAIGLGVMQSILPTPPPPRDPKPAQTFADPVATGIIVGAASGIASGSAVAVGPGGKPTANPPGALRPPTDKSGNNPPGPIPGAFPDDLFRRNPPDP